MDRAIRDMVSMLADNDIIKMEIIVVGIYTTGCVECRVRWHRRVHVGCRVQHGSELEHARHPAASKLHRRCEAHSLMHSGDIVAPAALSAPIKDTPNARIGPQSLN